MAKDPPTGHGAGNAPSTEAEPQRSRAPRASRAVLPALDHQSHGGDPPSTLLDYLDRRFSRVGRERWAERLRRGLVLGPEGPLAVDTPYRPHLAIRYFRELEDEPEIPYEAEILHRDEHLVVVDKPPFLPVVPSGPFVNQCLLYRVEAETGDRELAPIHRLDRLTSGLVLLARRRRDRGAYGELFAERKVSKVYEALTDLRDRTEPAVDLASGPWVVRNRIETGEPFFRMAIVPGEPNAESRIELIETAEHHARFRLRPITGKTHQLRLHMVDLGFPILGDRLYPELLPKVPDHECRPLALLARELRFEDPITGEVRHFESRRHLAAP